MSTPEALRGAAGSHAAAQTGGSEPLTERAGEARSTDPVLVLPAPVARPTRLSQVLRGTQRGEGSGTGERWTGKTLSCHCGDGESSGRDEMNQQR